MKQRSIQHNVLMNTILTVSSVIFPLITFPYASRVLLPENMGKVSFATAAISYFNLFAQLGIPMYGIRACAKVRDDKKALTQTVHELLLINGTLSLVAYGALMLMLLFVPKFAVEKELYITMGTLVLFNAVGAEWLYKALEQYTYITKRSLLFKVVAFAALFFMIHQPEDYVIYGGITIFASSASNLMNFYNIRKYVDLRWQGGYNIGKHKKPILIFFLMSCATTLYANLDTLMLGFIRSDLEVGYYNAAVKVKGVLVGLVTSVGTVILPRASYYFEKGQKDEFWRIGRKALKIVVGLAMPVVLFFAVFAGECIEILAGDAYGASVLPMQIVMPTVLLIGVTNILGIQMLIPMGREKAVLLSEAIGLAVNIICNFVLIPIAGVAGAALGVLITEFAVLVVQVVLLRGNIKNVFLRKEILRIMAGGALGLCVILPMKHLPLLHILRLAIAAVLFFGIYLLVAVTPKEVIRQTKIVAKRILEKSGR